MKNTLRIWTAVLLTALYCFAIGAVTAALTGSQASVCQDSSPDKTISELSAKLYGHALQAKSSINKNLNNLLATSPKLPHTELSVAAEVAEPFFDTAFSAYKSYSKNVLVDSGTFDLIFPFHNFW